MLVLSFLRVPIAISMGLVGFLGLWWMRGLNPSMASATTVVYESGFQYTLSVVPLFILMGNFVTRAGMSKELYRAGHTFVGHLRGGLAMATVLACAGFGAICGSSIATAATMTKVAYPSMSDHHYSDELAVGTIAAGGTLGILIPPSTIMVIYGIMTNTSIGKLFAAGILPGPGGDRCCSASRCSTSAGAIRPAGRGPSARAGASASTRSRASGPSSRSSSSSWAASTAASSPRPKAPASAPSAPSASPWRGAPSRRARCSTCWSKARARRRCCS